MIVDADRTEIVTPPSEATVTIPAQAQPPSQSPADHTAGDQADVTQIGTAAPNASEAGPTPADTPSSGAAAPDPAAAYGAAPSSGATYGAAPSSGAAYGAAPSSGAAYGAAPSSGPAYGAAPSSGIPQWTTPPAAAAPTSSGADAHGLPVTPSPGGEFDEFGLSPSSGGPRFGAGPSSGGAVAAGEDQHGLGPSSGAPPFGGDRHEPPFGGDRHEPPFGGDRHEPPFGGGGEFGAGGDGRYGFDAGADRFGFEPVARPGPRIEPSPPPQRNKLLLGILAGLVAGLLLFGAGGFFLGRETAGTAAPEQTGGPTPSAEPSLGVYEQSQAAINQAKLTGALAPISQDWLPYLSSCDRSGTPGGPSLNNGEKTRVRCRLDGMTVVFAEYATTADRDKARVKTLSQNVDARTLTPGVGPAGDRATPSGRTSGSYVEYAYTVEESKVRQTVAGIWWDDTQTPVAAYMLAFWKSGVAEDWAPMRDVWARYA